MGYIHRKGFCATSTGFAVGQPGSETVVIDASGNFTIPAAVFSSVGRMSTSTTAGASLGIDASTAFYAEGMEMRWHMADWADGSTTFTDAKGLYLRMENREANAAGSVYGAEVYGVSNNVANTANIWGGLFYAYLKGTTACTVTGMYALQPELSFDAGASAHTISEAACVRAKVTGGAMSDYTTLHGYKLIAGDMDGGSRTYGNAFWVVDDGDMSGTTSWTKGLYLQAACTTGIDIDNATIAIDATCAAIGATGRIAKFYGTCAAGNMGDGYGAVETDLTLTGTAAGMVAASSTWVNMAASSSGGGNLITPRNDGIYVSATGTPMSASKAVMGGRFHYVAEGGGNPGSLFLFSTNISDNALTAIFDVNAIDDLGGSSGAASSGGYKIPFVKFVNSGTVYYINLYTS